MTNVYINSYDGSVELTILENDVAMEYYKLDDTNNSIEGNIYVGKVRNVIQGMQSFFVDIAEKKNGFLFFNDIYEKYDGVYEKGNIDSEKISKILQNGQNILVQIKKEPIDNKGAKLTTDLSFIGRYFILTPKSHFIAISKKIENEEVRKQYIEIIKKYLPEDMGGIIRTNILEATDTEIEEEIKELLFKWERIKNIEATINTYKEPVLIYEAENLLNRTILDILNSDLERIYTNDENIKNTIDGIIKIIDEKYLEKVEYIETEDLLKAHGLRKGLIKDFETKVWLKCGGYLIINKTEALTAIDVNTGKYTGNKNLENTVFKVNKEAVSEIARQMRLRNMGGIIVVDFIDMLNEEHKQEILSLLQEKIKKDRSKIDIKGYTRLNLMEITRKKKKV